MEKGTGPSKNNKGLAYCYITSHMTPIHSGKLVAIFITLHLEVVYPSWDSLPSSGKLVLLYPLFLTDGFHIRKWLLCKLSFMDEKLRPIERKYFFQDFTIDSFQDSLIPWFQLRGWWFYFHVSSRTIFFSLNYIYLQSEEVGSMYYSENDLRSWFSPSTDWFLNIELRSFIKVGGKWFN